VAARSFFVCAALAGVWRTRLAQLVPRLGGWATRALVVRSAAVLIMTSALPATAAVLGARPPLRVCGRADADAGLAGGGVLRQYGGTRMLSEAGLLRAYTPVFLLLVLGQLASVAGVGARLQRWALRHRPSA
jgi:hypothetical protein